MGSPGSGEPIRDIWVHQNRCSEGFYRTSVLVSAVDPLNTISGDLNCSIKITFITIHSSSASLRSKHFTFDPLIKGPSTIWNITNF